MDLGSAVLPIGRYTALPTALSTELHASVRTALQIDVQPT